MANNEEDVQIVVDVTAGDTSGIESLQKLQNQLGQSTRSTNEATAATKQNSDEVQKNNQHLSSWLINAGNAYGALRNIQQAFGNINPQLGQLSQSLSETSFALVGISRGGLAAGLGLANLATIGLQTFTQLGAAGGEFVRSLQVESAVMGLTIDQTLRFKTVADLAGISITQMQVGMQRLIKAAEDVTTGAVNPASEALKKLHINVTNTDGSLRDIYDVFIEVMNALNAMTNQTERAAIMQELLGMRGRENQALISQWPELWAKASEKMQEHNGLTENADELAKQYRDSMTELNLTLEEMSVKTLPLFIKGLQGVNLALDGIMIAAGKLKDSGLWSFIVPGAPDVVYGKRIWDKVFGGGSTDPSKIAGLPALPIIDPNNPMGVIPSGPIDWAKITADQAKYGAVPTLSPNDYITGGPDDSYWINQFGAGSFSSGAAINKSDSKTGGGGAAASIADFYTNQDRLGAIASPFLGMIDALTSGLPKFVYDGNNLTKTIQDFTSATQAYDQREEDIKSQIIETQDTMTRMRMSGQQYTMVMDDFGRAQKITTDEYQRQADLLSALQDAEKLLGDQRTLQIDKYKKSIDVVGQSIEDAAKAAAQFKKNWDDMIAKQIGFTAGLGAGGTGAYTGYTHTAYTATGDAVSIKFDPSAKSVSVVNNQIIVPLATQGAVSLFGSGSPGQAGYIAPATVSDIIQAANAIAPKAASGGYVGESGLAVIHKGETVVPNGGGMTVHFHLENSIVTTSNLDDWLRDRIMQLQKTGRLPIQSGG